MKSSSKVLKRFFEHVEMKGLKPQRYCIKENMYVSSAQKYAIFQNSIKFKQIKNNKQKPHSNLVIGQH